VDDSVVALLDIEKAVVTIGLSGLEEPLTTLVPVQPVVPSAPEALRTALISPAPPDALAQLVLVPSDFKYLLEALAWLGRNALRAALAVVCPEPPLAMGKVPVTPVVKGRPVAFVRTAAEGVPRAGVVKAGELVRAILPEPDTFCPNAVATPVPNEVIPVPPRDTGKVPVVPPSIGRPVALVNVALEGVPRAGVTSVGLLANTTAPEPVVEPNAPEGILVSVLVAPSIDLLLRVSVDDIVGKFTELNCRRSPDDTTRGKSPLLAALRHDRPSALANRITPVEAIFEDLDLIYATTGP
jgi:hypothetical protein